MRSSLPPPCAIKHRVAWLRMLTRLTPYSFVLTEQQPSKSTTYVKFHECDCSNLYTLEGGVHNYLRQEGADLWNGSLFVFDGRMAVPPPGALHTGRSLTLVAVPSARWAGFGRPCTVMPPSDRRWKVGHGRGGCNSVRKIDGAVWHSEQHFGTHEAG